MRVRIQILEPGRALKLRSNRLYVKLAERSHINILCRFPFLLLPSYARTPKEATEGTPIRSRVTEDAQTRVEPARRGGKKKERGKSYKSVYFCRKLTERRTVPSSSTGHSTSSLSSLPFSVFNTCRFKGVGQHSITISDALLTRCFLAG